MGGLHAETGKYIATMIHIKVPLDVLLCRRLLRDFKATNMITDILREMKFYLECSRPVYFDDKLRQTADIIDGLMPVKQEVEQVLTYLVKDANGSIGVLTSKT